VWERQYTYPINPKESQVAFEKHHLLDIPSPDLKRWALACAERQLPIYESGTRGDKNARRLIKEYQARVENPDSSALPESPYRMLLVKKMHKIQDHPFEAGQSALEAMAAVAAVNWLDGGLCPEDEAYCAAEDAHYAAKAAYYAAKAAQHAQAASSDPRRERVIQVAQLASMVGVSPTDTELEVAASLIEGEWSGTFTDALQAARLAIRKPEPLG
jgi:hypothetical protein